MSRILEDVDLGHPELAELYDELPLWSAPFALRMLERVPLRTHATILDVGAGTGFLTVELAQRCGAGARVIAVDPWGAALARLRRKIAYLGLANVEVLEQNREADAPSDSLVRVRRDWLEGAEAPEARGRLRARTEEAVALGIFGAPSFRSGGELFLGERPDRGCAGVGTSPGFGDTPSG